MRNEVKPWGPEEPLIWLISEEIAPGRGGRPPHSIFGPCTTPLYPIAIIAYLDNHVVVF